MTWNRNTARPQWAHWQSEEFRNSFTHEQIAQSYILWPIFPTLDPLAILKELTVPESISLPRRAYGPNWSCALIRRATTVPLVLMLPKSTSSGEFLQGQHNSRALYYVFVLLKIRLMDVLLGDMSSILELHMYIQYISYMYTYDSESAYPWKV